MNAYIKSFGNVRIKFMHFTDVPQKKTTCLIENDEGKVLTKGTAFLYYKDNFDRAIGRKVALTNALKSLTLSKDERVDVWKAYWKSHKKR